MQLPVIPQFEKNQFDKFYKGGINASFLRIPYIFMTIEPVPKPPGRIEKARET
jgi:hypothetical protein